jgi:hypothetical protein
VGDDGKVGISRFWDDMTDAREDSSAAGGDSTAVDIVAVFSDAVIGETFDNVITGFRSVLVPFWYPWKATALTVGNVE